MLSTSSLTPNLSKLQLPKDSKTLPKKDTIENTTKNSTASYSFLRFNVENAAKENSTGIKNYFSAVAEECLINQDIAVCTGAPTNAPSLCPERTDAPCIQVNTRKVLNDAVQPFNAATDSQAAIKFEHVSGPENPAFLNSTAAPLKNLLEYQQLVLESYSVPVNTSEVRSNYDYTYPFTTTDGITSNKADAPITNAYSNQAYEYERRTYDFLHPIPASYRSSSLAPGSIFAIIFGAIGATYVVSGLSYARYYACAPWWAPWAKCAISTTELKRNPNAPETADPESNYEEGNEATKFASNSKTNYQSETFDNHDLEMANT